MVSPASPPYPPAVVALAWVVEGNGEGRPVLLLPEASRPAAAWPVGLVGAFAGAGHPVVRLDLRDQGRSPWVEEPYTLADLAADVAEVLGALGAGLGAAHVVGWGLGGAIALALACAEGAGIAGLTLVGTSGWVVDPALPGPDEPTAVALVWRTRGGTSPEALTRALGREHRALCGRPDRPDPATALGEAARWVEWGFNPHDRQRAAWLGAGPLWAAAAGLQGLRATVVHGAEDPLVPVEHGRRLATAAHARLVEVPGAGHELTPPVVAAIIDTVPRG